MKSPRRTTRSRAAVLVEYALLVALIAVVCIAAMGLSLGLWFWGRVWTLVAWCELRDDFRMFRIDRIEALGETGRAFKPERGKTLADFYRSMEASGVGG